MMILNFTNISKICLIFFITLGVITNSTCVKEDQVAISEEQVKNVIVCEKGKDREYIFKIILSNGEVFLEKHFPVEPDIDKVNSNTYKITISTGLNSNHTFFVDVENLNVSEDYFNLLFNNEKYVVYMNNRTVFVADMFDRDNVRLSVTRNYSPTAVYQSAILSTSIKNNVLNLRYLEGDAYKVVEESIKF